MFRTRWSLYLTTPTSTHGWVRASAEKSSDCECIYNFWPLFTHLFSPQWYGWDIRKTFHFPNLLSHEPSYWGPNGSVREATSNTYTCRWLHTSTRRWRDAHHLLEGLYPAQLSSDCECIYHIWPHLVLLQGPQRYGWVIRKTFLGRKKINFHVLNLMRPERIHCGPYGHTKRR